MFVFGFIRGAILGVSLGLMSALIAKKICKRKSKSRPNKKQTLILGNNSFILIYIKSLLNQFHL